MSAVSLPSPGDLPNADILIFDGQCRFCQAQVRRLHRLGGRRLAFLSLHDPLVAQQFPDLTHDELMRQMYLIDGRKRRLGGADAVKYLTWRLPLLWPFIPLLHFPGTHRLWHWLYGRIAKTRYGLAGMACPDGESCRLPGK